jgi:hypothetical protein
MPEEAPRISLNELHYLSWGEFKQTAPAILRLEITRLGKIIQAFPGDTDFHNSLVRARFALKQFIEGLEQAKTDSPSATCTEHLHVAIMNISYQPEGLDAQTKKTCSYIFDRLSYVYHRIAHIY